ncbi:hypothetical protein [Cellvibrio sp. PSBB006]|uniref:hypothetical protein n=1 Tax=Cellvibrio sp. PSBB006 TaxID=1987723 RepID=UPI0012F856C6|nr:hypothetical protein [Cellvibrio sp. PSBB006]
MTIAAVNAGISAYGDVDIYGRTSTPYRMALVPNDAIPPLHDELLKLPLHHKQRRMLRLSEVALAEALAGLHANAPIPIFLAGPESLPNCPTTMTAKFINYLAVQTGANIDLTSSRIIAYGRSAGIYAVELAFRYLESTGANYAIIGGVDSYLDLKVLGYLNAQDRVMVEGANDAFIPGEGASFLLLSANEQNSPEKARIYKPGFAMEPGHMYSEEPYLGEALSAAFAVAIKNRNHNIQTIYSSHNGESINNKEFGVALTRNNSHLADNVNHQHPAENFGDLGAATASTLIALATASRHTSLVYCASDNGQRAALCVN